ncbi:MAG: hypothetical protein M3Y13_12065 [Armatimonadota bacterium]|nr:hypothetical protein [Armatimonadota bacterium]
MNTDYSYPAVATWEGTQETLLLLAREQEWAEAYTEDHPDCTMGRVYLDFLRRELVSTMTCL